MLCRPSGVRNPTFFEATSPEVALNVEPKIDHVPVLHHILLPLRAQLPGLAALRFAAVVHEVLPPHDLGADEAALDVGVDLCRRLWRGQAAADRPGAALVLARGQ